MVISDQKFDQGKITVRFFGGFAQTHLISVARICIDLASGFKFQISVLNFVPKETTFPTWINYLRFLAKV